MSVKPKFCPECGRNLTSDNVCEKCSYNATDPVYRKSVTKQDVSGSRSPNKVWDAVAEYIPKIGRFAWLLMIIHSVLALIVLLITRDAGRIAWVLIQIGVSIVFALIYVLPSFSKKCEAKDYDFLLNDVIVLGTIRIPKMFLFGIIVEIFTDAWGGSILMFIAIMLIFFSPKAPFNWKV
jgi:hypothetical protein